MTRERTVDSGEPQRACAVSELLAETLVHLARLARNAPSRHGLTSAQWSALRYFARANRLSRTPSAFSEFHATTRGTASQTVKSLVSLGLLERHRNEADGRSARFDATEAGLALLQDDPLSALIRALERLPAGEGMRLLNTLNTVSANVAAERAAPNFGCCTDCEHLDHGAPGGYCKCTEAALGDEDLGQLCVDFQPRIADLAGPAAASDRLG